MACAAGVVNPCPNTLTGVSSHLFLALINTLMASQCSLGPEGRYPPDYGPKLLDGDSFDFIVVGAGSAGAVVANRLSEVEEWKVLLLEAGTYPSAMSEIPALAFVMQRTEEDWKYLMEPSTMSGLSLNDQRPTGSRGKAIGGSSTINAMIYIRGNKQDFDNWAEEGNVGWDYNSVLKYFQKSVNAEKPLSQENYGKDGYLTISSYENEAPFSNILENAYKELGHKNYTEENPTGYLHAPMTIEGGTRCNTGKAFISKIKDRKNLYVATHAHVTRILIDPTTKTANGVEVHINNKLLKISAKKEVIISAGSTNSPQILMNSGIGPKEHLEGLGIPVRQDLKVGENLQDHLIFPGFLTSVDSTPVKDHGPTHIIDELYKLFMHRKGALTTIDVTNNLGFVNTKNDANIPDIQMFHILYQKNNEQFIKQTSLWLRPIQAIAKTEIQYNKLSVTLKFLPTLLKPKSRGKILLKSADPFEAPLIFPNYLSDFNDEDLETVLAGVKHAKKLLHTKSLSKHNAKILDLKIPNCKSVTFDTDDYWRCAIRNLATTVYHLVGTCKMGPISDPSSVVDSKLKVHGINRLRVIDGSIMPSIVSANTNPACIMIGEKGSDLIKDDWETTRHEEL